MERTPSTIPTEVPQRWREWLTIAAICLTLGIAYSMSGKLRRLLRGEPADWGTVVTAELLHFAVWIVLYPAVSFLAARFPLGERRRRSLAVHLLAALVFSPVLMTLNAVARAALGGGVLPPLRALATDVIVPEYAWGMTAYVVLLSVASAIEWRRRDRSRSLDGARLEAALALARLQALRMQLQPHFLFNALNSVSSLLRSDPDGAERMLARLGDFLRLVLDDTLPQRVSLRRELRFLDSYLEIERVRFRDRLTIVLELPPDLLDLRVPALVLQPLFENAIRHGIGEKAGPGRIALAGRLAGGTLHLVVEDDGARGLTDSDRVGVGLANIRARLEQLYGARAELRIGPAGNRGVRVEILLPEERLEPGGRPYPGEAAATAGEGGR